MLKSKHITSRVKLLFGFFALLAIVFVFLPIGKTDALYTTSQLTGQMPFGVLQNFYAYNYNVNGNSTCYLPVNAQNPAVTQWMAQRTSPYTDVNGTVINVPAGTTTMNFALWHALFFCRVNYDNPSEEIISPADNTPFYPAPDATLSSNALTGYWSYIRFNPTVPILSVNAPAGYNATLSNIPVGTTTSIGLNSSEPDRYFFRPNYFNVNFTEPSTTTTVAKVVVKISLTVANVQKWSSSPSYFCTSGGGAMSSLTAAENNCPTITQSFTITFDLQPNSVLCRSNCSSANPCNTIQSSYPQSVNLPNTSNLPSGTVGSLPAATGSSPSSVVVASPEDSFIINSANDQWGTPITWSPSGYSPNPFTLNNYQYALLYPYDSHTTTIGYTQQFSEQTYVLNSSTSTYCSPYGTPNTCLYTYDSVTKAVGCNIVTDPNCYFGYGTLETYTTYYYSPQGSPSSGTAPGTSTATFAELCPRNFEVQQPPATDVTGVHLYASSSTPDQPNSFSVNTQTTVNFSLQAWSQNIHNPFKVQVQYSGDYYIEDTNGNGQTLISSPDNTTINFSSPNTGGTTQNLYRSFSISSSNLSVGDQICAEFTISPQSGEIDENGNISNSGGSVSSSPIPGTSNCSNPMSNYPYSRSYGNDVISGVTFSNAPSGTCNTSAQVIASITPSNGAQPIGSGNQFAVLSLGQIQYYASALLRNIAPTSSAGLSFANTIGTAYGGNFSSSCQSMYNYYLNRNQQPSTNYTEQSGYNYGVTNNSGPVQIQLSGGSNNYLNLFANYPSNSTKINGEHVIYVNGNVYIPNDITYDSSSISYNSSTGTVTGAPNLYVIASGNIYIGPGVQKLDGTYIAENQCDWTTGVNCSPESGTGGIINTCADPSGVPNPITASDAFSTNDLFSQCTTQLTVRGSLIGHEVKLERTYASMRNSQQGENPIHSGGSHNCSAGNGNTANNPAATQDCSAIIFNFDPVNYLGNPNFGTGGGKFDSVLSLPPVL